MERLKRVVLLDLERGMRLMLRVQDEIDPQFRFATPEGDVAVAVTFLSELEGMRDLFDLLRVFCAWKQVLAYTMTFNIAEPNTLMTVGVSGANAIGCMLRVDGSAAKLSEASFGEPGWVMRESIDDEFLSLLPKGKTELSFNDVSELEAARFSESAGLCASRR